MEAKSLVAAAGIWLALCGPPISADTAELLCRQGKYAESDALYLATLAEAQENLGGEHPIVAEIATQYAESLRRMDRKSDAKRLDRFARERRKAQSFTNGFTVNVGDLRDGRD